MEVNVEALAIARPRLCGALFATQRCSTGDGDSPITDCYNELSYNNLAIFKQDTAITGLR